MSFTRTKSGIKNQYFFYNVDCLLFVEGGERSLSIEEVLDNQENETSIDKYFWRTVSKTFAPNLTFKFKAVGSKTVLQKISSYISNETIPIYTAMDREFDDIDNSLESNKLYTLGYSWENDVWNPALIQSIIEEFSLEEYPIQEIEKDFLQLLENIEDGVIADSIVFSERLSFWPKGALGKCLNCDIKHKPSIKKDYIIEKIEELKIDEKSLIDHKNNNNIKSKQHCYGHIIGDYCMFYIRHILTKKLKLKGIDFEYIRRKAVSLFLNFTNESIKNHYLFQIEHIKQNVKIL